MTVAALPPTDDDAAPEGHAVSKRGDLGRLGEQRVILG